MGDKTSWGYLPQEIRLPILEAVMEDGSSLASLATVSREWQTTMERHNFARIRLTPSRIPDFDSMTHRNRALVRYIWVCLELEKYDCPYIDYQSIYNWGGRMTDNMVVTTALHDLFSALGAWEPQSDLLLDISLYSPSDAEYWFKELTFVPDFPSPEACDRALCGTAEARRASIAGDEKHGWTHGGPPGVAIAAAFHALLSRPYGAAFHALGWGKSEETKRQYDWWRRLPRAPAVTGLLLRQQTRRRFSPLSVAPMLRCLPRVREVHYEPWRHWSERSQLEIDGIYKYLFAYRGLARLERLVLFENFDQRYPTSLWDSEQPPRTAHPAVGRSVARASLGLKHMSGAFVVDAGDVFRSAAREQPAWAWPNLATIALTSRLLAPDADQGSVDDMLLAAADAASRMPSLETMEIWNGREGLAGLFRYRSARGGRTAGISWRGTWGLALGEDVIQAWENVANMYRRGGLVVVKEEVMDAAKIRFHGDAIHHLGLEAQVVRPVSLYQMRMERDIREGM